MASSDYLAKYQKLFADAQSYDPNKFTDMFNKQYGETNNFNADLIAQKNQEQQAMYSAPAEQRAALMGTAITDPTAINAALTQAQATRQAQYGSSVDLLNARGQKQSDILGKALGAYTQGGTNAQNAAEAMWRTYQDQVQQEQFQKQLNATLAAIPDYGTGGGGDTGGGDGGGEIPVERFSNPTTGKSDQYTQMLNTLANTKNQEGFLAKLGTLYNDSGWKLLNPFYSTQLLSAAITTRNTNLNPSKSSLTTKGIKSSSNFAKVYAEVQKALKSKKKK
jgi:hypothetical protein